MSGRLLYQTAINAAIAAHADRLAAVAKTYLAIEETRIGSILAANLIQDALNELMKVEDHAMQDAYRIKLNKAQQQLSDPSPSRTDFKQ